MLVKSINNVYKSCSYLHKLSFCVVDNYPKLSKLTPWGPTLDYKLNVGSRPLHVQARHGHFLAI
jgi:hypothetical protein